MITGAEAVRVASCPICNSSVGEPCRTPIGRKLHHSQTHVGRYNRVIVNRAGIVQKKRYKKQRRRT
jgi:hypothetical protein